MGITLLAMVFLASGLTMLKRAKTEATGESRSRQPGPPAPLVATWSRRRFALGVVMLILAVLVGTYAVLEALT